MEGAPLYTSKDVSDGQFARVEAPFRLVTFCGITSEETLVFLKLLRYTEIAVSGINKLVILVEALKSHKM